MVNKKNIEFKITTPEKEVYSELIDQVTVPTKDGDITVLPEHMALVSSLRPGELIIKKDDKETVMAVSGGFIQIQPKSKVVILADSAERAEEIDEKRAEEARKKAEKLLEQKLTGAEMASAEASLAKSLARLQVVAKYRKRKRL